MAAQGGLAAPRAPAPTCDVARIRRDFPVLARTVHGRPLVYLDNAATSQKPRRVIDAVSRFYAEENANIHRGVHALSERATAAYDAVRARVRAFFNAASEREIVFTGGTTDGINLVARSYARSLLRPGDEVLVTEMEHHSNIVPWQMVCEETGATLRAVPVDDRGDLLLEELERLLGPRTRVVAVTHLSNALGTVNPVRRIVEAAHAVGAAVLVDGAQSAAHLRVDVRALGCDFFVCSGHKLFGPTGVGVLYGREELLERMPPWRGGGGMIASVSLERTTYAPIPMRFEAGTPPIAPVIGLGAALEYLETVGLEAVAAHEQALLAYATERVRAIPGLRLIGTARERASVLSFVMEQAHPHDIGTILDREGIAIRAGHHCAQPIMRRFGVPATARASFALYNTREEVDALVRGLERVVEVMG
ncbi:MAG TPA: cysteine desulfurase [Gemmatimonadales bacterium]|nr:cysteine desulfurase [Gemmatimonadales bacterium]